MFRTGESSTTNDEGPTYYVGLNPSANIVNLGSMDNGWTQLYQWSIDSLDFNVAYTVSVYAVHNLYYIYFNQQLLANGIELTEFTNGSIGLRTYSAPSTYYSVTYSEGTAMTITPNSTIGGVDISTSESTVTTLDSWSKNNGEDSAWFGLLYVH